MQLHSIEEYFANTNSENPMKSKTPYQSRPKLCKTAKKKTILTLARAAQQATDDFHIAQASERRPEFPINSYVLVKYRDRPPSKLHSNWKGALRVVSLTKVNTCYRI